MFSSMIADASYNNFVHSEEFNKSNQTHFYKSLMFQAILDNEFDRDERDVLLVIFRKTLHYNKQWDYISVGELSYLSGASERKTKEAVKRLESKAFIDVRRYKGGRSQSRSRFNAYRISAYMYEDINNKYRSARRDHDFNE